MSVSLNLWILSLFFINVNLYVNPDCLNCLSGMNLALADKNLFAISFVLYLVLTCDDL